MKKAAAAKPPPYRMPAEWEPHAATWLAWPHNVTDWPGKFECIPWAYAEIVRWLARGERVELIVNHQAHELAARVVLQKSDVPLDNVRFHRWPTNRGWLRDSGPIFVRGPRGKLSLTDWRFNAWAKYDDWQLDDQLPARIAELLGLPVVRPVYPRDPRARVVLEGGSIDVNGRGTLLTTVECLLSHEQQRNPGLARKDIERVFADSLGIRKVIWLERGIVGDDTHGHIDDIARFVAPRTVLAAVERRRRDPNYAALQKNLRALQRATDQDGRRLQVVELPMPRPIVFEGNRLPASYANFYIANAAVLVPVFNDPSDRLALDILARLFPRRDVVPIYCGDFIWGLGAIHCMTQQQPR